MKILVTASTFPSSDSDPVPAFVKDQIIALNDLDHNFTFSVLAPHDARSRTKSFTAHTHYDEYRFHYFWPFRFEKLAGRGIMPALKANPLNYLLIPFLFMGELVALLRLTNRLKPDMIYAHWFTPQAIAACWVGIFTKTPFVFTTHASDVDVWRKVPFVGGMIVRSVTRRAQAFTAVSTRSMGKLAAFFSSKEWRKLRSRSALIPMGVDLPSEVIASPKSDHKSIVFVGRLAEKKGVQYLLPAFANLHERRPDIRLTIGGDGPMLGELKDQADKLRIGDAVEFPGFVSGDTKQSLIASADVYAVPSIITRSGDAEGLPVSLMEGLSHGRICVATFESGADDILTDGKDGFLIPEKDVDTLEQALEKVLNLSEGDKRTISAAARSTAKQLSWHEIAKRHRDFLLTK